MGLFDRLSRRDPPDPPPVDRAAKRFAMTQTDPDFAHVRDVYHDGQNVLAGKAMTDQLHDRFNERWRDSWRSAP